MVKWPLQPQPLQIWGAASDMTSWPVPALIPHVDLRCTGCTQPPEHLPLQIPLFLCGVSHKSPTTHDLPSWVQPTPTPIPASCCFWVFCAPLFPQYATFALQCCGPSLAWFSSEPPNSLSFCPWMGILTLQQCMGVSGYVLQAQTLVLEQQQMSLGLCSWPGQG